MEHCVRIVVPLFSSPSSPPTVILCKPATIITANYGSRCQQLYRSTRAGHTVEENAEEGDEGRQMAHFISAQYRSEVRPKGWSSLIQTLRKSSKHIIINHSTCWCLFLIILCYNKIYIYFFFSICSSCCVTVCAASQFSQHTHLWWRFPPLLSQSHNHTHSHSALVCATTYSLTDCSSIEASVCRPLTDQLTQSCQGDCKNQHKDEYHHIHRNLASYISGCMFFMVVSRHQICFIV